MLFHRLFFVLITLLRFLLRSNAEIQNLPEGINSLFDILILLACGLQWTHGRVFLNAKIEAEVLGFQMRPNLSRESKRLKSYSHPKLQL